MTRMLRSSHKPYLNKLWLLTICLSALASPLMAQQQYSDFIVFGDSLSDTGNLASGTFNFPFPYYENRISDGPVAIDYVAQAIGKQALASAEGGNNYSVAGGNIIGSNLEDLSTQISSYLTRVAEQADARALYLLMIGGNDLRDLRAQTSNDIALARINDLVVELIAQLSLLDEKGASTFMLVNVANVGRIPETLQREVNEPGISARATRHTIAFNQLLSSRLQMFRQQTDSKVVLVDFYSEVEKILDTPAAFGFRHIDQGCFNPRNFTFHSDCVFGTRFDRFVFFDNLHPSGAANQLIGAALVAKIPAVPVDKPINTSTSIAAILMLLLGE